MFLSLCVSQVTSLKTKSCNLNLILCKFVCTSFVQLYLPYTEHCTACSNQTQTARVYQNADSSPSKHEALTQCCFNVGPVPLAMGQYWNSIGSNPRVCWAPHRCLSTPTPTPTIIFLPADQCTFSKTAGQSQAYYNTWNWERGTFDVSHLQILTCEGAVSRVGSVYLPVPGYIFLII